MTIHLKNLKLFLKLFSFSLILGRRRRREKRKTFSTWGPAKKPEVKENETQHFTRALLLFRAFMTTASSFFVCLLFFWVGGGMGMGNELTLFNVYSH